MTSIHSSESKHVGIYPSLTWRSKGVLSCSSSSVTIGTTFEPVIGTVTSVLPPLPLNVLEAGTNDGQTTAFKLVSSSADDSMPVEGVDGSGIGARIVRIIYWPDKNVSTSNLQSVDVEMNGTTPKDTGIQTLYRIRSLTVVKSGAQHTNVGTINLNYVTSAEGQEDQVETFKSIRPSYGRDHDLMCVIPGEYDVSYLSHLFMRHDSSDLNVVARVYTRSCLKDEEPRYVIFESAFNGNGLSISPESISIPPSSDLWIECKVISDVDGTNTDVNGLVEIVLQ